VIVSTNLENYEKNLKSDNILPLINRELDP